MVQSTGIVQAIFGGTLGAGGLVFFFIGLMNSILEGYRGTGPKAKRAYRFVAYVSYLALLILMSCIGLSASWLPLGQSSVVYIAMIWTLIAFLALLLLAASVVVFKIATMR